MVAGRLTPLQERVLEVLAGMEPRWTLTGGAALAGVHLGHRVTRDVDLFWHGKDHLGTVAKDAERALRSAGMTVRTVQTTDAFVRLQVEQDHARVLVDLVADPASVVEEPTEWQVGRARILVDTPHEILVNKLCALLGRGELRDLLDVDELLRRGGDLERALADAPRKDGGFSPLTLAWTLGGTPIENLGDVVDRASDLDRAREFRDRLVARLLELAAGETGGTGKT